MILGMVVCVVAVVIVFVIGLFLFPEPKAQPITDDTILHIPVRDIKQLASSSRNLALEEAAVLCDNRAQVEIDYGFAGKGKYYARPYQIAAEEIRELKK